MSYEYSEEGLVEKATEDVLNQLDWDVVTAWHNETFGKDGLLGRENKSQVILEKYLFPAFEKLNPDVPATTYPQAIEKIRERQSGKSLAKINKEKYEFFKKGVPVSYTDANGGNPETKIQGFRLSRL